MNRKHFAQILFILFALFSHIGAAYAQSNPEIRLQYKNGNTNATGQQELMPRIKLFNDSDDDLDLTDITIRYWFSSEPPGQDVFVVDYAAVGNSNVTGSFGTIGGERYLQVGFTSAATIPDWAGGDGPNDFPSGSNTSDLELKIRDDIWSNQYDQSDDFSWDNSITDYADYTNITVYYQGTLVWGVPPAGTTEAEVMIIDEQPTNTTAGTAITPSPIVILEDILGNPVAGVDVTVTLNQNDFTVGSTTFVTTDENGEAVFDNLIIESAATGYEIHFDADAASVTDLDSDPFNITEADPEDLSIGQQPTNTTAGTTISPSPSVTLTDEFGNPVSGIDVTISLNKNSFASGTTTVSTNSSGIALFSDLVINTAATNYQITFDPDASGVSNVVSGNFNISAATADVMTIIQQPLESVADGVIAGPPTIKIADEFNNPVSGINVTISETGGYTFDDGTVTKSTNSSGVAVFNNLEIQTPDTDYQLEFDADASGVSNVTSNAFDVLSAGGTMIISQHPAETVAGITLSPAPAITLTDGSSNPISGVDITVSLNQGSFASGTLTVTTNGSGIAAFSDLVLETADTGYELTFDADESGVSNVFSNEFDVIAAGGDAAIVTTQPTNTAAGNNISGPPSITLSDEFGNPVSGVDITVTLNKNSFASGTTTATTNSSGVASFSDLKINIATTGYQLTFDTDTPGVDNVNSSTFNITAAAASTLAITVQPDDATVGTTLSPSTTVRVRDAFGNNKSGVNVTATINQNSFAVGSTTTVSSNSSGLAVFSNLKINTVDTDYQITFSASGPSSVASAQFDILQPDPPFGSLRVQYNNLEPLTTSDEIIPWMRLYNDSDFAINLSDITIRYWFTSEPNGQDVLEVDHLQMGAISNVTGTFGEAGGKHYLEVGFSPSAILAVGLGGDGATANLMPSGATTGDMQIRVHDDGWGFYDQSDDYSFDAGISTYTDYEYINVYYKEDLIWGTPPAGTTEATDMTITEQPVNTIAGNTLSPSPTVYLEDALGNPVSGIEVTATLSQNNFAAGSITIVTTDENGEAIFDNLIIETADSDYQINFDPDADLVGAQNSNTFDISTSDAETLSINQQPTTVTAGNNISPFPSVILTDEFGNTVSGVNVAVSLNKNSFSSGTTTVATNSSGVATFNNLVITQKDTGYQLTFDPDAVGVSNAVSSTFNINSAAAAAITITQQPQESVIGGVIAGPPAVKITDTYNNPVSGSNVTVSESGGYTFDAGILTRATNSSGIATFNDLAINTVDTGYILTFDPVAAGISNINSNTFDVISSGGSMSVIQQPTQSVAGTVMTPSPSVEVLDDLSNPLVGVDVTISLNQEGFAAGTLTVPTDASGIATFTDLAIEAAGTGYEITFDADQSGIANVFSEEFDIIASDADAMTLSTQPSNSTAGSNISGPPAVSLTDEFGNPISGIDITVSLNKNSFVSGTTTVITNSSGIASFTDLKINTATTNYQLTFAADVEGVSNINSNNFNVNAAAASSLAIMVEPEDATAGVNMSPPPAALVTDTHGNPKSGVNVTVTLNQGTFVGGSTTIVSTNSNGLATFTNLKINTVNTDYEMTFSATGLTPDVSNPFDVIQPDPAFGTIRLQYQNNNPTTSASSIIPKIQLFNESGLTLKLSDITIRYWFTSEPAGTDEFQVDNLEMGPNSDVTGTFDEIEGNRYFEIGFSQSAVLEIGLGGNGSTPDYMPDNATTGDMEFQIHDSAFHNYDQSDDYSFDAGISTYTDYEYINVYYKGQLVWGISPAIAETFYSRQNGIWSNASSWSRISHAGTVSSEAPGEEDTVIIGGGDVITLTSNLTNDASITVDDTGTLVTATYIVSGSGDFTLETGGTLRIGSADGIVQSGTSGNIQSSGTRSFSSEADYVYNGNNSQETGGGLPTNIDGDLTINNSSGVTASQSLQLNGTLHLSNGSFIFDDGIYLIANDKNITSGNLTFRRILSGQAGYRMLSSPIDTDYSNFLNGVTTQGFTGADYGTSYQPNVLWYDETVEGTENQRWRNPGNITDDVVEGRGYHIYVFGEIEGNEYYDNPLPDTLSVSGQEFEGSSGNVDFNVTYTPEGDQGWNLVGNPFGAPVDWEDPSWTKQNISSSIYIWDPNTNQYVTWNGVTGDIDDGIISPFQGFWIQANDLNPDLVLSRDAKTLGGEFFGKQKIFDAPVISLEAYHSENFSSTVHFSFTESGSNGMDDLDAYKLLPPPGVYDYLEIYSTIEEGERLAINNLPRKFGGTLEIPVELNGYRDGIPINEDIWIKVKNLKNIPSSWQIYLIDEDTGNRINISEQDSVQISMDHVSAKALEKTRSSSQPVTLKSKGEHVRYTLAIEPGEDASDIPALFELHQNYPNPFSNITTFRFDLSRESHVRLDIFDITGRRITTLINHLIPAGSHTEIWDASGLSSGTYFCRLITENGQFSHPFTIIR